MNRVTPSMLRYVRKLEGHDVAYTKIQKAKGAHSMQINILQITIYVYIYIMHQSK